MDQQLLTALIITLLGMGLVFGAIFVLWGAIALLVHLTRLPTQQEETMSVADLERKRQAALAAVSVALAMELDTQPHEFPLPPTALVSAWQLAMRAKVINSRGISR